MNKNYKCLLLLFIILILSIKLVVMRNLTEDIYWIIFSIGLSIILVSILEILKSAGMTYGKQEVSDKSIYILFITIAFFSVISLFSTITFFNTIIFMIVPMIIPLSNNSFKLSISVYGPTLNWLSYMLIQVLFSLKFNVVYFYLNLFLLILGLFFNRNILFRYHSEGTDEKNIKLSNQQEDITYSDLSFCKKEIQEHSVKLRLIRDIDDTTKGHFISYDKDLRIIKSIFLILEKEPLRILSASDFLYKDLPDYYSVVEGTSKMLNSDFLLNTDQKMLKEVQDKIRILSKNIENDYRNIITTERASFESYLKLIKESDS